jgi:pimeloyl-ACP methyl ester carboxylesterase
MTTLGHARFHLVGHDWGGQIAWMIAARAPERLHSLAVLSRPHPAAFVRALREDPQQAARSGHHKSLLAEGRPAELRESSMAIFRAMFDRQKVPQRDALAYCGTLQPPGALEAAIEWYRASAMRMRQPDFPTIRVPTTYLWGNEDSSVGPMAARGTAQHVDAPYRFVEIPGAGHFLTDQAPEQVNAVLAEHLGAAARRVI